jgi:hypothetical protein
LGLDQLILEGGDKFFTVHLAATNHDSFNGELSRERTLATTSTILSAAWSISSNVVKRLTEKRIADETRSRSSPMAKRVGDGSIDPLAHAVPAEA